MSQVLNEIGAAIADAADNIGPSVVGLGRGWGRGTGVVIADGQVLTTAHVLRGDDVAVTFRDGRTEHGRLAAGDSDADIAVVSVATGDAPPLTWDPDAITDLQTGTPVIAIADPGGRGLRATLGFVSATGRSFRGPRGRRMGGSIEHTAPLPRGASGSPLVDLAGRLVGINAVRLDGGLILAVPADASLHRRVEALARGERPARPRLGVALAPPRAARRLRGAVGLPERDGLLVRAVEEESPGARAGLERGDLLVAAGDAPLASFDDLFDALDRAATDGKLTLTVVRGTEEREVAVEL